MFWKYKPVFIPCLCVQAFIIYYVCLNGQSDIDAHTYLAEVTTILDTGRLAGVAPQTGLLVDNIPLKTGFTMFGTNSALLCSIFRIHPLIFCRTVRSAINIIMLAAILFEIFMWIYSSYEECLFHAVMALMLSQSFLFLFANSIYTHSAFILHRTYEGKAYCSGVLTFITLYLSARLCKSDDKKYFIMVFMVMVVGMSLSASSMFILPLVAGCVIGAHIILKRKWSYLVLLGLSVVPNLLYVLMTIMHFPGFILEG